jgi:drug/metabolite transporter (DMT)-like permease
VSRGSNDPGTWGLFLSLSIIWGSSYLFIKIGLDEGVAPLTLVAMRTVLGTAFLALVMRWQGARLPRAARTWLFMGIVGLTNIVIPYALITWGELHISSGMAGILTAMVPLFTVALASLVLHDEPVTRTRAAGLAVGFGGVVLLAAPSLVGDGRDDWLLSMAGMVAVALAALSYAVAVVHTRKRLSGKPVMTETDGSVRAPTSLEIAFGQVFVGMLVITPLAVIFDRPEGGLLALPPSGEAVFALVWLGLAGTGVAYLLYFAIIGRWGATRATLITYVMPVVAIGLGFAVLGERLQTLELVGAGLIIGGVMLVNVNLGRRRAVARGPEAESAAEIAAE